MVSRASSSREFYLLGFTLALYGSGLMLAGTARGTVATVMVTLTAFGLCDATTPTPLSSKDLIAALTFLSGVIVAVVMESRPGARP